MTEIYQENQESVGIEIMYIMQPGFNEDFPEEDYEGYRWGSGGKCDPNRIFSVRGRLEDIWEQTWQGVVTN